jgi:ribosomal protein S11
MIKLVMYIIDITFSRSNTFLNVMDPSGNLKFFCSAGCLQHKGKNKKFRFNVFKSIYHVLTTKLRFLKGKPIALHLKNVGFNKYWLIKKLKSRFFIKSVKVLIFFHIMVVENEK